jgi:hypothetical protein
LRDAEPRPITSVPIEQMLVFRLSLRGQSMARFALSAYARNDRFMSTIRSPKTGRRIHNSLSIRRV